MADRIVTAKKADKPWGRGDVFWESQKFKERLFIVEANWHGALWSRSGGVDLRLFAAWVRETGWDVPAELLAMADEPVASQG
jgi:hypothetical protein